MIQTPDIERPPQELMSSLTTIGSATASGELYRLGISDPQILGPVPMIPGKTVVGPALTLQFMPKREDQYSVDEYVDPEKQLHRHVLYHTQPGDVVVVDARSNMSSGVFGEMMLTYFKGRGGSGVIVDGCIRDFPYAANLGLGLWLRGVTPNFHTQTNIFPFAVNQPIACGGTLVMPGDIIVADDDGVVVLPQKISSQVLDIAKKRIEIEEVVKNELQVNPTSPGKYYPFNDKTLELYNQKKKNKKKSSNL